MLKVTAVANGYYGGKIRVPGEEFGIEEPRHFSTNWMDSDDPKILSEIRRRSKEEPDEEDDKDVKAGVRARAQRYKEWLKAKKDDDGDADEDAVDTRRVNTGGTDGVVGAEVPVAGAKTTAKQRKALAEAATGKPAKSQKDADAALDALAATGSDNDDRSRDAAVKQANNAPAPDWEAPVPSND